jgi:hypothetical protein
MFLHKCHSFGVDLEFTAHPVYPKFPKPFHAVATGYFP